MCDVADDAEADGDFVLALFWEDGFHDINCLASGQCYLAPLNAWSRTYGMSSKNSLGGD